ncbi:hypothetical protein [Victivallis lenta]|uniref:hypothetical protein n=1 Tax=Victivallis lenta TaxID=2606640 RepID=UPI003AF2E3F8
MERSKAFRRFQDRQWKKRAKELLLMHRQNLHEWELPDSREIGRLAGCHCRPCSCFMCGNPRKFFSELSLQERRVEIDFQEEVQSYRQAS